MTTKLNTNHDHNNTETPNDEKCLQLSAKLDQAIATLRPLPEFQTIAREEGNDIATMEVIKFLRETRPELFNAQNPADGLASLYAGMD